MLREVPIGWDWQVYVEMFLAGIAAGAYLTAMVLELMGRGRSPIARTAHLIAMPLALVATMLLVAKLERPDRFWHMVIQSEMLPAPMLKWWAPISAGSWGLMAFSGLAFVSFVDALVARDWFGLGPWRPGRTLHGSILGKLLAIVAIPLTLFVGGYSGALLSVTALRGWTDTVFIGPFFLAITGATGVAFLLLVEAFRRAAPRDELRGLERAGLLMVAWQMVMLVILAISLGGAIGFFLTSFRTVAAAILGTVLGLAALLALLLKLPGADGLRYVVASGMILASGLLLRYAVVMGPQHAID
jgi:formate-dependent nitrite reductase membrane component NrfD